MSRGAAVLSRGGSAAERRPSFSQMSHRGGRRGCGQPRSSAFTLLEEFFWINFLDYNRAILGGVIVILIFFLPGGLLHLPYRELLARVGWRSPQTKAAT